MLIEAQSIPEEKVIETDVCIVGAGAAGVTLAKEFMGGPFRVALIESGNLDFETDTQNLYKGENLGHSYRPLDAVRLRYLGGTTNHWGGNCRPLDASDFEEREWIPHSGWPFPKTELDPYYERAQPILQLGPYAYTPKSWETGQNPPLPFKGKRLTTAMFQQRRTNFGQVYRSELDKAGNITTYLNANVIDIDTNETASKATRLRIATLEGNRFWIRARIFVLATGGIEVPRLLLLSNRIQKVGLGNQNDLVGRFFLEHPILHVGTIALSNPGTSTSLYEKRDVNDFVVKGFLTPSIETQRELKLLNFGMRPSLVRRSRISKGVASYKVLRKGFHEREVPDDFFTHLSNVIREIDEVYESRGKGQHKALGVRYWQECAPNPLSRVTLNTDKDALGMSRVSLDWRLTDMDKNSMRQALKLVGEEVGRAGIGRLHLAYDSDELWSERIAGSAHHMGTTRMSDDPRKGVVDRDAKVHGIGNLYIASSSVFPVTGHVNPTLTIVALSVRLADHIKERMA